MSRVDRDDPVIAELKKLGPVALAVTLRDGSLKSVNTTSNHRNKWSNLQRTLDGLPWDHIEALDKDGKLLGAPIERDGDIDDEGDFDDEPLTGSVVRQILHDTMRVNLEVMRTTMKETRQIFAEQTKSQSELVGVMVEGLRAVQESYTLAMRVQTTQLAAGIASESGNDGEVLKMLQMAMMQQVMKPSTSTAKPPASARPANPPPQQIPPKGTQQP